MATEIEILQHIAKTGECDTIEDINPCAKCPLAKVIKRPDGIGWLSCIEVIAGPDMTDISIKYKKTAEIKLFELAMDKVLNEHGDAEEDMDT